MIIPGRAAGWRIWRHFAESRRGPRLAALLARREDRSQSIAIGECHERRRRHLCEPLPRNLPAFHGRPGRVLGRGGRASTGSKPADTVFDPAPASMAAGSSAASATPATMPSTATSPEARRAERHHLRQPGHRNQSAPSPTRSSRTRSRCSAPCCEDLGVGKGDRVILYMPMIPEAVDRHAGLRPHRRRSIPSCSAASPPRSSRPASTTPRRRSILVGVLRHRAEPDRRLQAAARRGDRARRPQAASAASSSSGRRPAAS